MCDDIPNFALFELHPMSAKGMNILRHNQELGRFPRGFDHFVVTAKHVSQTGRGLVAVGREFDNDIQYKQGNRYLCTFSLTSGGDVLFLDSSGINNLPMAGLTATRAEDAQRPQRRVVEKYCMSIDPERGGHAQQRRVIPLCAGLDWRVEMSRGYSYSFRWCVPVHTPQDVARTRHMLARIFAARPQLYTIEDVTGDGSGGDYLAQQRAFPLCQRTPPESHWYTPPPRSRPGRVYQAVDLRSGRVYAVKRLMGPTRPNGDDDEPARLAWKRLARLYGEGFDSLQQISIQAPQFIGGLTDSHPVLDLYYMPQRGNARDHFAPFFSPPLAALPAPLHAQHRAGLRSRMVRFSMQMLQALAYLDARAVVHCNIKPENVLVQAAPVDLVRFILVDFAFGPAETHIGTPGYMAPETRRYFTRSSKADVYALGITILELMGLLSVDEFRQGMRYWYGKLAKYTPEPVAPGAEDSDHDCLYGHKQVQSLYEHNVLSSVLDGMVRLPSERRLDIEGANLAFAELGEDALFFGQSSAEGPGQS